MLIGLQVNHSIILPAGAKSMRVAALATPKPMDDIIMTDVEYIPTFGFTAAYNGGGEDGLKLDWVMTVLFRNPPDFVTSLSTGVGNSHPLALPVTKLDTCVHMPMSSMAPTSASSNGIA